jgi:hypothetical protein
MFACLLTPLFCLLAVAVQAQSVRLSEFMVENVQSVPDIVDFEDYPDWKVRKSCQHK